MTTEQIIQACESHQQSIAYRNGWIHFGLRALNEDETGLEAGDDLRNSYQTFDGEEETELNGTSSIGFISDDEDSINSAIQHMQAYSGRPIAIIVGCGCEYGNDDGEWILRDAMMVHRF